MIKQIIFRADVVEHLSYLIFFGVLFIFIWNYGHQKSSLRVQYYYRNPRNRKLLTAKA